MNASIEVLSARDDRWILHLQRNEPSLFQESNWANLISDTYGFNTAILAATSGGSMISGIPFAHIYDFRGSRRVVFPFSDSCEALPTAPWPAFEKWLAQDHFPWQIRTRSRPSALATSSRQTGEHHVIALPPTVQAAQALFHPKHLANVKQAVAAKLVSRRLSLRDGINSFYRLHSLVRKNKYRLLPQPRAFFDNLVNIYENAGFIMIAERDSCAVAAMLFLSAGRTLYYKFSASALDSLEARPNHFLITAAIEEAIGRQFLRLDLGISETDGLIRFKNRIGGKSTPVYFATYGVPSEQSQAIVEMEAALKGITDILTAESSPLEMAQRGGDTLYRFFT